jgi:hypothetical protein
VRLQQRGCFLGRDAAIAGNCVNGLAVQHTVCDSLQLGTFGGELLLAKVDSVRTIFINELLRSFLRRLIVTSFVLIAIERD